MANIPADFKHYKAWAWAEIGEFQPNGKRSKKIFTCEGKTKWAKSNDPATWGTFDQACAAARQYGGLPTFALSGGDPYLCIDIDHCIDPKGVINDTVKSYIDSFEAYVEVSASGNGVHIFSPGRKPSTKANYPLPPSALKAEIYERERFIVVSGAIYKSDLQLGSDESKARNEAVLNVLIERGQEPEDASTTGGVHAHRGGKSDDFRYTEGVVRAMLKALPVDHVEDYAPWRNVGFELQDRFADDDAVGVAIFDDFSSGRIHGVCCPKNYPGPEEIKKWWAKLAPREHGENRTFRSLVHEAKQHGWVPPPHLDSHENDGLTDAQRAILQKLDESYFYIETSGMGYLNYVKKIDVTLNGTDGKENVALEIGRVTLASLVTHAYARYQVPMETGKKDKSGNAIVETVNLLEYWNEHRQPGPRVYSRIDFDPSPQPDPAIYNLWSGFHTQPLDGGDVTEFLDFLLHNICGQDDEAYAFFLDFFAQLFQCPHRLPMVALVLRGEKRSGKSGIVDLMARILGKANCFVANHWKQVTGQFNAHLASKLLLVIDDATWGGYKEGVGFLNNLVTAHRLAIEGKGRDPINVGNFCRVVVIGNDQWLIPKTRDDGRFFVIDVPPRRADDAFYRAFFERWQQPDSLAQLMGYLLRRDIAQWKPIDLILRRTVGHDMGLNDLTPLESFIFTCASAGSWIYPPAARYDRLERLDVTELAELRRRTWPCEINIATVRESYQRWCDAFKKVDDCDPTRFSKKLYQLLKVDPSRIRKSGSIRYWKPPTVEELRQLLCNQYKLGDHYFD